MSSIRLSKVYIEDYSPKSFVVRGDTQPYKEQLKNMSGKWTNGLTDNETGEKFGAWLFWSAKKPEIQEWLSKDPVKENSNNNIKESLEERVQRLESTVSHLVGIIQKIGLETKKPLDDCVDYYEDCDEEQIIQPKRLLKKNK
jgi:hypothetical protein